MNKMPVEETLSRIAQVFHSGDALAIIWNIIRWVAFFFKLASLACAIPLIGLVVFDFFLWIWRINRPPPRDTPQPSRNPSRSPSGRFKQPLHHPANGSGSSSATTSTTDNSTSQRRTIFSTETDNS
ncbi:Uu.00g127030.m01.CDS01 [Anthostomella pinea]|uniref:Uu.00g127030.m01.CDS01 n=1 Tax=Anthostomella pinea TaxID=933095 RepID=A0AAI8YHU6_9PEZI|nr:Uu.00g127030.m01.CDS01 [Anthostomella pinea]